MRASRVRGIALGSSLALAAGACSSGKGSSSSGPPNPTQDSDGIAEAITIDSIAAFQTLKVPLASGGNPADHGRVPIVAGRDLLLRVYVTPDQSFTASKTITAR